MGRFSDYENYDALGLGALIRQGQVSASEVLEEAIERTDARNPVLNAVVARTYAAARARAAQALPDTPIAGVPFLIKDLAYVAGVPCTSGSRLFADNVPDHDATVVARYRAAGLVIFGKTNTPEFGLNVTTEPALFGPTRNPWNPQYTSGGSSGGASAAVADGWLPVAHATDGGGSIRIPASWCALVGLKPSRGRNPTGPDTGEGWGGMSTGHVVSRTVRDSAAFLDATHGPAPGDPYCAPNFDGSYLDQHKGTPRRLRIAVELKSTTGVAPHPECVKAVEIAAQLCAGLGHAVEHASPVLDLERFGRATSTLVASNIANTVNSRCALLGRELHANDIEPHTAFFVGLGRQLTGEDYARSIATIHQAGRTLAAFHERFDIMIAPVLVAPPVPIGWLDTCGYNAAEFNTRFMQFWGFTNLQNATGQPSISLPLHWSADGLPIGVQFVGPMGAELLLLQLARQIEEAQPWFNKRPAK